MDMDSKWEMGRVTKGTTGFLVVGRGLLKLWEEPNCKGDKVDRDAGCFFGLHELFCTERSKE